MSKNWDKLAGEKGEEVPQGRFNRLMTLGKMGAKVGLSALANKAQSLLPEDDDARDARERHAYEQNAGRVVETLGKLKGASMKVGQMLSADPELVPEGFGDMLSSLQNAAPPMTYKTISKQIEQAFDLPMEVIFSYFDPEPVGAASIGQVHRARLADGDQEVAVKIQYPGVVTSLRDDLKSLGSIMMYARATINKKRLNEYLDEIHEMIIQEANYEDEARNLQHFSELLAHRDDIDVPKPFMKWTRPTILTMEFKEGVKLDDALMAFEDQGEREALLLRWVELYTWMFHENFEMHGDPHPGNFLIQEDGTLVILDFGSVKRFEPEFADGILELLDSGWQDEPERAADIYRRMGFASKGFDFDKVDPNIVADYHQIVFAPFMRNEPFDFSTWNPGQEAQKFMFKHPRMLKLTPPSQALPYFRMLSGIKGLLKKTGSKVNVCQTAIDTARKRGKLTQEPIFL